MGDSFADGDSALPTLKLNVLPWPAILAHCDRLLAAATYSERLRAEGHDGGIAIHEAQDACRQLASLTAPYREVGRFGACLSSGCPYLPDAWRDICLIAQGAPTGESYTDWLRTIRSKVELVVDVVRTSLPKIQDSVSYVSLLEDINLEISVLRQIRQSGGQVSGLRELVAAQHTAWAAFPGKPAEPVQPSNGWTIDSAIVALDELRNRAERAGPEAASPHSSPMAEPSKSYGATRRRYIVELSGGPNAPLELPSWDRDEKYWDERIAADLDLSPNDWEALNPSQRMARMEVALERRGDRQTVESAYGIASRIHLALINISAASEDDRWPDARYFEWLTEALEKREMVSDACEWIPPQLILKL
jgi:hypothetical protein